MRYIFLISLFSSCSYFQPRDKSPKEVYADKIAEVKRKKEKYCALAKEEVLKKGYAVAKCDGLLFSSLHALGCGYLDISTFVDKGRTYRSPTKDCFQDNGTSTTSKDMVAGYGLYNVVKRQRRPMEEFMEYCRANPYDSLGITCKIGDSRDNLNDQSKVIVPIAAFWKFDDFVKNKKDHETEGNGDARGVQSGFLGHLDVIGVLTDGAIYGAITQDQVTFLESYANYSKNNALFEAAYRLYKDGDMNRAADLLLDESKWPSNALPTTKNMCTDYLYQRDEKPHDWLPCPEKNDIHDGTDFIFAASVLLGEIK